MRSLMLEMFNPQRQRQLSSFRLGLLCCVLLIGLLLALLLPSAGWSCDNCPTTMPPKNHEWAYDGNSFSRKIFPQLKTNDDHKKQQNMVKTRTQRPASVSSEDIAKLLAVSSRKYVSKLDFGTTRITKWETPLRVRILDGTGEDLPDDYYQRKSIAAYLEHLSQDIQFPISITTRDNNDNNVSLIIGMLPRDYDKEMRVSDARNAHLELIAPPFVVKDEFGAILGVSSMDDAQKKLANIWLGKKGTRGEWHGQIEFSNIYDVDLLPIYVPEGRRVCSKILNEGADDEEAIYGRTDYPGAEGTCGRG